MSVRGLLRYLPVVSIVLVAIVLLAIVIIFTIRNINAQNERIYRPAGCFGNQDVGGGD